MQAKQSHQGKKYDALKKNVDDVNVKYNLDGDDKVKTETVQTRCKKGRKLWLHLLDLYLVCLNWNLFLLKPS